MNLRATASFSSAMPSTLVYLEALPLSIALIAACLMLSGVSKSGSPAPSPMTLRPARFQRARLVGDGDGRRRLDALEVFGEEGHCHNSGPCRAPSAAPQS